VPKAGGSSVERYLIERGGALALRDPRWGKSPPRARWSATSPQHMDASQFRRLFPAGFFDSLFMVVRHPEDRILSEYRHRAVNRRRDARAPFSEWLAFALAAARRDPLAMDGHLRPQSDFVCGPTCAAFRLEDGLSDFVAWLDAALGEPASGNAFETVRNVSKPVAATVHHEDRAAIETFYAADYDLFGYARRPTDALPPLPAARRIGSGAMRLLGDLRTRAGRPD
jgi:hypothetical protein